MEAFRRHYSYGITGGDNQVYHKHVDSLIIQDLYFTSLNADLVNLGHIEDARNVRILGLLGANLFFNMEMEIDVRNSVLYLYKIDADGNRQHSSDDSATHHDLQLPIEVENNIMFINAVSNTKKLRFCRIRELKAMC